MECSDCKFRKQIPLKRCKHFELGGDKKRKVRIVKDIQIFCICVMCAEEIAKPRRKSMIVLVWGITVQHIIPTSSLWALSHGFAVSSCAQRNRSVNLTNYDLLYMISCF